MFIRCASSAAIILFLLTIIASLAEGQPTELAKRQQQPQGNGCRSPKHRREWRTLSRQERIDYVQAIRCLTTTPAGYNIPDARTVWDEIQWVHAKQIYITHAVGAFLPWHRYFLTMVETLLERHCRYNKGIPFLEQRDFINSIASAPVWDDVAGFGGNSFGQCLQDGPFAGLGFIFLPDSTPGTPYCLRRDFNETLAAYMGPQYFNLCFSKDSDLYTVSHCIEQSIHWAGHMSIGGLMHSVSTSAGEPYFYTLHAWVDYMYWLWQMRFPNSGRNVDGPNVSAQPFGPIPPAGPELVNYLGDPGSVTTMNHNLWMGGIIPNVTIGEVLAIDGPAVCATYQPGPMDGLSPT